MLDDAMKAQLRQHFTRMVRPVEILASLDDGAKSAELATLLAELATLSDHITVTERRGGAARTPAFALTSPGEDIHLAFAGIPMGHEFTSLVLALLQTGGYPPKVSDETIAAIRAIDGDFRFETYYSLSCQNCPDVVQALNLMAVLNPNIRHVAIDGALFQGEVEARQVMSVPSVYLNGEPFAQGRMEVDEIVAKLDTGAEARAAEKIAAQDPFDVLIVGGGPAGAAAAVYAARKGIRTGILAGRFGGQVLDTMAIENFVSVRHTEGPQFAGALEAHVKDYDVELMTLQTATALRRHGDLFEVELANGASAKGRTVILSTGARWRQMGVPGEEEYRNKGVAYCPHCDGPLFKGKPVAVVGGGNSGVEAAIDLAGITSHVTLLEFGAELRADEVLQKKLVSLPNVTVLTSARTTEVRGDGAKVVGLTYEDLITGEMLPVDVDGIFVQIGLLPNTEWLRGTVALTDRGEVEVAANGETSLKGVFAAGDCTTVPYKQIVIAVGEGAKASLGAFDHLIRASVTNDARSKAA
ncbi:alkyl hydroperoxide reductase subunit F [Acuticoccus sp. I52.16.1]|uniref:alkyl hydroperoxide reductase subunit F n=1 Tax=Acuticoccus sp. I52.16.1 TaxID=2928472 RepID=UPI001FCFBCA6|nr:alkyl hydroperoxide reductase subunit F [Acuticoccus sp. I52.16.1]UOM32571.1 alkyl hydroperoxide reductase subunit F [Acuticoccus sp. I52.16.1]